MKPVDLLNEYELLIDKMLKLDVERDDEVLLTLLSESEKIQLELTKLQIDEMDNGAKEQVQRINTKMSEIQRHVASYMNTLKVNIDNSFQNRVSEGKKKMAFQKIKNIHQSTQGYYFDRKK
jgi:hypothetical protein